MTSSRRRIIPRGGKKCWRMSSSRCAYAAAKADFAVETVERVDRGKYIREKIYFNTTPELRVPAYVLVPKNLKGKAPAIVALHDHGGFYRWGKEKLVKTDDEHPALTEFKQAYAGHSHRRRSGRAGLRRHRHRHLLLGRAAGALAGRSQAGASEPIDDVRQIQRRAQRLGAARRRARSSPPASPGPA